MKKNDSALHTIWRMVKLNLQLRWQRSPLQTILMFSLVALTGTLMALTTPALEFFVSGLERAVGGAGMSAIIWGASVLLAVQLASSILSHIKDYYIQVYEERIKCDVTELLMKKLSRKEPICFENTEMLDSVQKALQGVQVFYVFCSIILLQNVPQAFIYLVGSLIFLGMRSPLLALILLLSVIPMTLAQNVLLTANRNFEDHSAPVTRACDYFEKCMTDREYFKETRLLGAYPFVHARYHRHLAELFRLKKGLVARRELIRTGVLVASLVGFAALLIVLVTELAAGRIAIATFAAFFASLLNIYSEVCYTISYVFECAANDTPKVANLFKALDLPERQGTVAEADGNKGIQLHDVHFRYPGAEKESLRGVTLDIAPKETIAIVGENGAGKTTLVRLLTGLYPPTEGSVRIGGSDTKDIDMPSAMAHTSAVFQKYMRYRLALSENIRISDPDKPARDIAASLDQAGLPLDSECFLQGADTMLAREFGGVDLSGGQWQRVAIARGLYRAHGMIVLDEPTAAIDPLEETRIYQKFAELSKDVTAVIVTHRMGSARVANRIVMMKDGVIDDIGTHDELMARGGEYARMVEAQSEWYASA